MAQLSRPYQIGLAVIVLLAAVWAIALRGHSGSSASPSAPVPAAPSAPGVAGLSKDVAKAHGAVATSERNAHQLQQKSEQASSASASTSASASASTSAAPSHARASKATSSSPAGAHGSTSPATATHASARQRAAEAALKKGDVVVLLFWDAHGSDDVAVHDAVQSLKGERKLFTSQAPASQVASYGSITRGIQVYGTPTLLIVDRKGKTITLTGLQDAYSIRQAIAEARQL